MVIFNADPGTTWEMRIFDMMGLAAYGARDVFAGSTGSPGPRMTCRVIRLPASLGR